MYKQELYKILPNYVKTKILKRNNRYKKWEYGYNEEHDFVVISKSGMIGDVYEIPVSYTHLTLPTNREV